MPKERRSSLGPLPPPPLPAFDKMLLPFQTVLSALKKSDLLGTPYIPTSFQPSVFLQLDFPSGASVQLGNHVLPSEGVEEPIISFLAADPTSTGESYALLSFDPDAPSRENQEFGPWRHWIVGGLKPVSVDSIAQGSEKPLVEKSEEALTPWTGPSPGKATGDHRYIFLLYNQSKPLLPIEEQIAVKSNERIDRRKFNVAAFVEQNGLELVGANFFLCENP